MPRLAFAIIAIALIVTPAIADDKPRFPGPTENGFLLPNGWHITPVGQQVETADLPLNISRELLQENPLLAGMRKDMVKSVLKALEDMKADEYDRYVKFYKGLGPVTKQDQGVVWPKTVKSPM